MYPQMNGLFPWENPIKMDDDWGYPQFRKPPNWAIKNPLGDGWWVMIFGYDTTWLIGDYDNP